MATNNNNQENAAHRPTSYKYLKHVSRIRLRVFFRKLISITITILILQCNESNNNFRLSYYESKNNLHLPTVKYLRQLGENVFVVIFRELKKVYKCLVIVTRLFPPYF